MKLWPWVLGAVIGVAAVTASVMSLDLLASRSTPSGVGMHGVLRALGGLSSHDLEIFESLDTHVVRFNAVSAPLIDSYLDPDVSAREWARKAGRHIDELRLAVAGMEADVPSIEDLGVRSTMEPFPPSLREQVAALVELRGALARLDMGAEKAAVRHLRQATAQRAQFAEGLLDRLKGSVDPETLETLLAQA